MIRCTSAASSASGTSTSIPRAPIRAGYSSSEDIVYRVPSRPRRVTPAAWAASATASTTCTTGTPALATSSYSRCIVLAQMPSTVAPALTRAVASVAYRLLNEGVRDRLERLELGEVHRAQHQVSGVGAAEAVAHSLVEQAVVVHRRLPRRAAEEADPAHHSSRSHAGLIPRAYWISSLLTPAATIGQTMASRETVKSTTTG